MRIPLSGVSEAQREHFNSIQQCYATLNALLPYAAFSRLPDDAKEKEIDRAAAFIDLAGVSKDEKYQVVCHLRLLKTKRVELPGVQQSVNAILDDWESRRSLAIRQIVDALQRDRFISLTAGQQSEVLDNAIEECRFAKPDDRNEVIAALCALDEIPAVNIAKEVIIRRSCYVGVK